MDNLASVVGYIWIMENNTHNTYGPGEVNLWMEIIILCQINQFSSYFHVPDEGIDEKPRLCKPYSGDSFRVEWFVQLAIQTCFKI